MRASEVLTRLTVTLLEEQGALMPSLQSSGISLGQGLRQAAPRHPVQRSLNVLQQRLLVQSLNSVPSFSLFELPSGTAPLVKKMDFQASMPL